MLSVFQSRLTDRQRQVFLRVWVGNEDQRRVAADLGVNHRRVKQIVSAVKRRAFAQSIPLPPLSRGRRHRMLVASAAGPKGMDLDAI